MPKKRGKRKRSTVWPYILLSNSAKINFVFLFLGVSKKSASLGLGSVLTNPFIFKFDTLLLYRKGLLLHRLMFWIDGSPCSEFKSLPCQQCLSSLHGQYSTHALKIAGFVSKLETLFLQTITGYFRCLAAWWQQVFSNLKNLTRQKRLHFYATRQCNF